MIVYTNCDTVTLTVNGQVVGTVAAQDHAAVFADVPLQDGENTLTATAGNVSDTITLFGVAEHDSRYDLPDLQSALQAGNWFTEQDEAEDYGENGHNSEMTFKVLLNQPRCLEIIKGWVMSKTEIPAADRFRFVAGLSRWGNNENYSYMTLHHMGTITNNMTEEDFAHLNKLLRSVKKEA